MTDKAKLDRYYALAHAMQSGVAMMMNYDPTVTEPKHLRVGINEALLEQSALGELLIAKGLITEDEYMDAMIAGLEKEVRRYEETISFHLGGAKVTLG